MCLTAACTCLRKKADVLQRSLTHVYNVDELPLWPLSDTGIIGTVNQLEQSQVPVPGKIDKVKAPWGGAWNRGCSDKVWQFCGATHLAPAPWTDAQQHVKQSVARLITWPCTWTERHLQHPQTEHVTQHLGSTLTDEIPHVRLVTHHCLHFSASPS